MDLKDPNAILNSKYTGFTPEEDQVIERFLHHLRDRIRSGKPLSHQMTNQTYENDNSVEDEMLNNS